MKLLNSALAVTLASSICAVAAEVDWSAPVRVLGTPPAEEPMNVAMRRPPPPKSLVRGLLPQYQTPQAFRSEVAVTPDTEKAAMRFLLALPDRVLLIEASVSINGQPYKMVREQRIDRLLAVLNKPASEEPGQVAEDAEDSVTAEPTAEPVAASSSEPAENNTPSEDQSVDASNAASEPEAPLIPVPSDALEARLRRYATVTGRPPTRDELRWLLTKWVDGPTLLILDDNFQRFRGTQAPAFQVLDRDIDGKVSAQELKDAEQTLLLCDVNQNDVVEYAEIAEVADDPRRRSPPAPVQALVPILDAASAAKAFRRLAKEYGTPENLARFDGNSNGRLDESEFGKLAEVEPDVVLAVSFDANDSANSTTRITHVSTDLGTPTVRRLGSSMTIPAGPTLVEFSAVQSATWSGSDQISVGVVNDGYPLLPAIDPNEDRRLTIRELRQVVDLLQRFDVNKDGEISANEIPSTVRVSFGLGPSVHLHLGDIRKVHPPSTAVPLAAPEWFTSMDGNRDGDISPREFLLGPERFKKLDADNDGLISPAEAIELIEKDSQPTKPDPEPKPEEAKAKP